jgi:hypothetical protein
MRSMEATLERLRYIDGRVALYVANHLNRRREGKRRAGTWAGRTRSEAKCTSAWLDRGKRCPGLDVGARRTARKVPVSLLRHRLDPACLQTAIGLEP